MVTSQCHSDGQVLKEHSTLALEVEGGLGSIYKKLKAISVSWKAKGNHSGRGMGDRIT